MPTTEFEKRREHLINNIRTKIVEDKEVEVLINLINKLILKREAKIQKAQKAKLRKVQTPLRARVHSITSLQSTKNITHEEALQELAKMIEPWK
ncbi:MAG: hypothetical protein LBF17_00585 [Mediterranea sp.]|jgi:hypothetical protein|nr:hypothetical protein [Mediterranea sp.]